MKTVEIRGMVLGDGCPKICVPVVGRTAAEIIAEGQSIAAMRGKGADLCEWRLDWYEDVWDDTALQDTGRKLADVLNGMPLLCTFRTSGEGGAQPCAPEAYAGLVCRVCGMGFCDLVDMELLTGESLVMQMSATAKENGVRTVFSNHDFAKTPPKEEIVSRLARMEAQGADICKIAVMPTCRQDVLTLLEATVERSTTSQQPLITMSMGAMGTVSRLCGALTGSCLTFGSLSKASAPGQIPAEKMAEILPCLSV